MEIGNSLSYGIAQWLFIKGLGLAYLFAFLSLYSQLKGLFCSQGIEPISIRMAQLEQHYGGKSLWRVPSIFWWLRSDWAILGLGMAGILASFGVIAGYAVVPLLLFLYLAYMSFTAVGSIFLCYQWDSFLLEVGFASIFLACQTPASPVFLMLMWFLLFRFMFSAGMVKILSRDPNWKSGFAMCLHYQTQPLPTPLAWYAQQLPAKFQKLSCLAMLIIEIVVPFGIFGPAPVQLVTFVLLVLLQVAISLTGNYAFFNFLTIVMCVLIVPDQYLSFFVDPSVVQASRPGGLMLEAFLLIIGFSLGVFNAFRLVDLWGRGVIPPRYHDLIAPFGISNHYGLFAIMTTRRDEIIVEGSDDGQNWKTYEFRYKAGNVMRRLPICAPHQPRLDWQMWFAALGDFQRNQWFGKFMACLLLGKKDVAKLLAHDPFPNKAPTYLRARLYRYRFTNWEERKKSGAIWHREPIGDYTGVMSLK